MYSIPKSVSVIFIVLSLTGCSGFNKPSCPTPPAFVHPEVPTEPLNCPRLQYVYIQQGDTTLAAIPIETARDRLICEKDIVRYIKDQREIINFYRSNVK